MSDILERSRAARLALHLHLGEQSNDSGPLGRVVQSGVSDDQQTDFAGPLTTAPKNGEWSSGPAHWTTPDVGPLDTPRVVQGGSGAKQLADNDKTAIGPLDQLDHSKNGNPAKKIVSGRELRLAECLSRLQAMPFPADIEVDRWALFLADAAAFLSLWGPAG